MKLDNIIVNKCSLITKALNRISEEYDGSAVNLRTNITKQDAILLNLQRACETAIDLAMHLVRVRKLGAPQASRQAFEMLVKDGIISTELGKRLSAMVGFRNTAVHDYQELNLDIVESILKERLVDFEEFIAVAKAL